MAGPIESVQLHGYDLKMSDLKSAAKPNFSCGLSAVSLLRTSYRLYCESLNVTVKVIIYFQGLIATVNHIETVGVGSDCDCHFSLGDTGLCSEERAAW